MLDDSKEGMLAILGQETGIVNTSSSSNLTN